MCSKVSPEIRRNAVTEVVTNVCHFGGVRLLMERPTNNTLEEKLGVVRSGDGGEGGGSVLSFCGGLFLAFDSTQYNCLVVLLAVFVLQPTVSGRWRICSVRQERGRGLGRVYACRAWPQSFGV